jgi:hypothetical protein
MIKGAFSGKIILAKRQPNLNDCRGCRPGEIGFTFHRAVRNKIDVDPHMGVAHMKLNSFLFGQAGCLQPEAVLI